MKRLAMVKENIFSHIDLYEKPKLGMENQQIASGKTTIYSIASVMGRSEAIWVVGLLTQRDDTHFYIEDSTHSIRVRLDEIEYADPNCFISLNMILLFNGSYHSG